MRSATTCESASTRRRSGLRAGQPPHGLEHDVGARVAVGVEEVAEAGDATVLAHDARHGHGGVEPGGEQRVGGDRGRAVERPGHRGIRGREAVVQPGAGGGGDARGDGRGREAVVEQGDEQDPGEPKLGGRAVPPAERAQQVPGEVTRLGGMPRGRQRARGEGQRGRHERKRAWRAPARGRCRLRVGRPTASSCTATGSRRSRGSREMPVAKACRSRGIAGARSVSRLRGSAAPKATALQGIPRRVLQPSPRSRARSRRRGARRDRAGRRRAGSSRRRDAAEAEHRLR